MKAIAYSLFGFDRGRVDNCFSFDSYLRGLMINIRFNRLLYPDWSVILETDQATYQGFEPLFKALEERNIIRVEKNPNNTPLCAAMLWRIKPVFWTKPDQTWEFTHVICRDLDSPATYREVQAVNYWISKDRCMHAITDSISHDVPLMGGMIGIRPDYFSSRLGVNSFTEFRALSKMDLSYKGSDQHFLNHVVYPKMGAKGSDSITQHYILGHGNTFLSDWHNTIDDIGIGVSEELKETNAICGHIGASGYYEPPTMKIIHKYKHLFSDLMNIEKQFYPQFFYWNT